MKYRADIDGLRAIAIISVVIFHAFPNFLKGGFIGVDIFFVISGYLITTIIFNDLGNGSFTLKKFYIRRIRRILPALILVLLACLVFGWFALLTEEYSQLGKHVFSGTTFISNFVFWKESGYFDELAEKKPLLHLWSLAIEEQYYVIWPLIVLFLWFKKINILIFILTLTVISFAFNIIVTRESISTAFFLPHTRFWELLIGSVVAYLVLNGNKSLKYNFLWGSYFSEIIGEGFKKILYEAPSILGIILICGSIFFITDELKFPGWYALFPVIGTAFVIISPNDSWLNKSILSHRILVWIGLISFPLYLWHWPILSFARILRGNALSDWLTLLCIFLSLVCATATYFLLEKPFKFSRYKFNTLILLVLIIFVGLVGYVIFKKNGLSFRLQNNDIIRNQFNWNSYYNKSEECQKKFPGDDYCNISNPKAAPNVAIIGDSHANHFYWGLNEFYKARDKNLINMGSGGCPPLIGIKMSGSNTSPNCYSRMRPIFELILNSKSIETVYISFWHSAYFDNRLIYSDNLRNIYAKDNYEFFLKALDRTIKILQQHGKRVIIVYDLPDLKLNIKDCFIKRPILPKKNCTFDKNIFRDDFKEYDGLIENLVLKNKVEVFYTHKYLNNNFPVDLFGIPTYRDHSHLSINGSLFFSEKFNE